MGPDARGVPDRPLRHPYLIGGGLLVEGGQVGVRVAVVSDGVAFLNHAGGEFRPGIDVLSDHKESRRHFEIRQDLQHPLRVRVQGPVVKGEVCAHGFVSRVRCLSRYVVLGGHLSQAQIRRVPLGRLFYCGTRRTCPGKIKLGSLIWLRFASNIRGESSWSP